MCLLAAACVYLRPLVFRAASRRSRPQDQRWGRPCEVDNPVDKFVDIYGQLLWIRQRYIPIP